MMGGGLQELLDQRDRGLSWLTLIIAALAFCVAALLPMELSPSQPDLWRFGVTAPSGWVALAGLCWACVTMWVVRGTRQEGEPPESAATWLSFAVAGLLAAAALAGADLLGVARSLPAAGGLWVVLVAAFGPWRQLGALSDDDPGRRLERVWRLHAAAGRLLALGALAPMLVVMSLERLGTPYTAGDPSALAATLAMMALVGVSLAGVCARQRAVAVGLDEARLGLSDLPPQPPRRRAPQVMLGAGVLTLGLSGLGEAPWPEAAAVSEQLVRAGLVAPADGRSRWMVLDERAYRSLVGQGEVRVDFAPTGAHVTATVDGPNPGFWVLWEKLSWYPQQLRDLWNISELAFSPDGSQMLVGRQRGLLQLRSFPAGREESGWLEHAWRPVRSKAGRLVFLGDAPHALDGAGALKAWSSEDRRWRVVHTFSAPPQGLVPSPDGARLATLHGSWQVTVWDAETFSEVASFEARGARELLWAGDDSLLAVGQGVRRFDVATGEAETLASLPVRDAALAADGRRLAIASGGVRVIDLETGETLLREERLSRGVAASVSWHSGGGLLAVGSTAGNLELWWVREHR